MVSGGAALSCLRPHRVTLWMCDWCVADVSGGGSDRLPLRGKAGKS